MDRPQSEIRNPQQIVVSTNQGKIRLDKFLAAAVSGVTRSRLQQLIKEGNVTVNGERTKASHLVQPGETIQVNQPPPQPTDLIPEEIPLRILYEDDHLAVIDKPAGLVVHPAYGHPAGTLANALVYHFKNTSQVAGGFRPGIVHRLDKDTSGLLVVAKDDQTHAALSAQFKRKSTQREYAALVWGRPKPGSDTISSFIVRSEKDRRRMIVSDRRGKWAVTHYETVEVFSLHTLLRIRLETGRTHQIRVHLAHRGHPVFGDPTYGGRKSRLQGLSIANTKFVAELLDHFMRQALHARVLGFVHPLTNEELHFESSLPEDMEALLQALRQRGESGSWQ